MQSSLIAKSQNLMMIQLCYSLSGSAPVLLNLSVSAGDTIHQVLLSLEPELSHQLQSMLEKNAAVAVFGKKKTGDFILSPGDRLEICRTLIAGPMDARRRRAKREHKSGKM
ncbi:RnfH family protein [Undibacterium sp. Di24W]|uniref:RnfH family protein n=1 Tax=Undibacterium sp. Di24W TaxID=3413033 RepID=UPI003BEFAF22